MAAVLSGFQLYRLGYSFGFYIRHWGFVADTLSNCGSGGVLQRLVPLEKGEEPEEMQETQTEEDVILEE